jgi:ubiquitin carboxyl-terminal hydrolase 10
VVENAKGDLSKVDSVADIATSARPETPSTQDIRSEEAPSTTPTTPSSLNRSRADTATSATPTKSQTLPGRSVHPALPVLPKHGSRPTGTEKTQSDVKATEESSEQASRDNTNTDVASESAEPNGAPVLTSPPPRQPPSSWANLFAKTASLDRERAGESDGVARANGPSNSDAIEDSSATFPKTNSGSLGEAIRAYSVGRAEKIAFIEPRGLINTGNMCYMNSVSLYSCPTIIMQY